MKARGFTLLEVLIAMAMFTFAVGGLALSLDRAFSASLVMRHDGEIRQQIASLIDQAMILPIETLHQGLESDPDALGVKYTTNAELVEDLVNREQSVLNGLWKVTVRAVWKESGARQEWKEEFLRYQP